MTWIFDKETNCRAYYKDQNDNQLEAPLDLNFLDRENYYCN